VRLLGQLELGLAAELHAPEPVLAARRQERQQQPDQLTDPAPARPVAAGAAPRVSAGRRRRRPAFLVFPLCRSAARMFSSQSLSRLLFLAAALALSGCGA